MGGNDGGKLKTTKISVIGLKPATSTASKCKWFDYPSEKAEIHDMTKIKKTLLCLTYKTLNVISKGTKRLKGELWEKIEYSNTNFKSLVWLDYFRYSRFGGKGY